MEKKHFSGNFLSEDNELILFFNKLEQEPLLASINSEKLVIKFSKDSLTLSLKENNLYENFQKISLQKTVYIVEIDKLGEIKKEYEISLNKI